MNKSFPKEKYQEICRGLQPSRESVREVITMKEPKKYSRIKRKTFVGAAACVTLIFSLSVGVVAATNGDIVQNATNQLIIWYENLTIDKKHLRQKKPSPIQKTEQKYVWYMDMEKTENIM